MAELGLGNLANYGLDVDYSHTKEITGGLQVGMQLAQTMSNIELQKQKLEEDKAKLKGASFDRAMTNLVGAGKLKDTKIKKLVVDNAVQIMRQNGYQVDEATAFEVANNPDYSGLLGQLYNDPEAPLKRPEIAAAVGRMISDPELLPQQAAALKDLTDNMYKERAAAASQTGQLVRTQLTQDQINARKKSEQEFEAAQVNKKALANALQAASIDPNDYSGANGPEKQAAATKALGEFRAASTASKGAAAVNAQTNIVKAETGQKAQSAQERNIDSMIEYRKAQAALLKERPKLEREKMEIMKLAKGDAKDARLARTANTAVQQVFRNLEPTSKMIRQANMDLTLFREGEPMSLFEATEALKGLQRMIKGPGVLTNAESQELSGLALPKITQWENSFRGYTGDPLKTKIPDSTKKEIQDIFTRMYANQRKQFDSQGNADIANRESVGVFTPEIGNRIRKNLGISPGTPDSMFQPVKNEAPAGDKIATAAGIKALRATGKFKDDEAIKAYIKSRGGSFNEGDFK